MSAIDDVVAGGWWPLRHHATVDAALRYVRMACLVRADQGDSRTGPLKFGRDRFGRAREVDGSAGDVQCGLIWEAAKPVVSLNRGQLVQQAGDPPTRDFPSLGFVFPAVVQDAGGAGPQGTTPANRVATTSGLPAGINVIAEGPSTGSSGVPMTQSRPTTPTPSTVSGGSPPPPMPDNVKLLPIQDEKITPDKRYAQMKAAVVPGAVKGSTGVVLAAMHERRMEPVFLQSGPLRAANAAGDPSTSSLVFDEKPDGTVDPSRYAPLHSAWRVVRLSTACAPGLTASSSQRGQLAWQLGGGGLDGLAGYGLAYDASGGASGGSASSSGGSNPAQQEVEAIRKQMDVANQRLAAAVAAGSAGAQAIGQIRDLLNQLTQQLAQAMKAAGSSSSTPQTQSRPTASSGGSSGVLGAFSWRMGGPFDAGGNGCQHQIGRTFDGEAVYSGHLRCDSYFRGLFDGPFNFESTVLSRVSGGPYQMATHLVWNPTLSHSHPCGTKQGKWWWYSEAMDYLTEVPGDPGTPGQPDDPGDPGNPDDPDHGHGGHFGGGGSHRGGSYGGGTRGDDPTGGGTIIDVPGGVGGPNDPFTPKNPSGGYGVNGSGSPHTPFPGTGYGYNGSGSPTAPQYGVGGNGSPTWKGPTVCQSPDPHNTRWRATSLLGMSPGAVYRPQDMTIGVRDYRTLSRDSVALSQDDIAKTNAAPAAIRMEAFAERKASQWRYGIQPNASAFPGGSAVSGGLWVGPADRDIKNELSGVPYAQAPVSQAYQLYHPSVKVGTGSFNQNGTNTVAIYNPFVALPQGTTSGFVPKATGGSSYTWAAASVGLDSLNGTQNTNVGPFGSVTLVAKSSLIPGGTLTATGAFRIVVAGKCTNSVAGTAINYDVRFGSAGTTADPAICGQHSIASGTGGTDVEFRVEVLGWVTNPGAFGVFGGKIIITNQSASQGIISSTLGVDLIPMATAGFSSADLTTNGYLSLSFTNTEDTPITVNFSSVEIIKT